MRLLKADKYEFEEFADEICAPKYVILSHTWEVHELTFASLSQPTWLQELKANDKIMGCCRVALQNGMRYVWIDTICIDKSSSAELSEAINSMFKWYQHAAFCCAYLADVGSDGSKSGQRLEFRNSHWFTRAWTLQELLAPREVYFFDRDWRPLGQRSPPDAFKAYTPAPQLNRSTNLCQIVEDITKIPLKYLAKSRPIYEASVAQRMSWASKRQATRREDVAYSLMGIFDVNMAMLYGEGDKAFLRLQREILSATDDDSILAWAYKVQGRPSQSGRGVLADSPADFAHCGNIQRLRGSLSDNHVLEHHYMTNKGLLIQRPFLAMSKSYQYLLPLSCVPARGKPSHDSENPIILALPLVGDPEKTGTLQSFWGSMPVEINRTYFKYCQPMKLYLGYHPADQSLYWPQRLLYVRFCSGRDILHETLVPLPTVGFRLLEWHPAYLRAEIDNQGWRLSSPTMSLRALVHMAAPSGPDCLLYLRYTSPGFNTREGPAEYGIARLPEMYQKISLAEIVLKAEENLDHMLDWLTSDQTGGFKLRLDATTLKFIFPNPK